MLIQIYLAVLYVVYVGNFCEAVHTNTSFSLDLKMKAVIYLALVPF